MNKFWKIAGIGALVIALAAASMAVVGAQGPQEGRTGTMWQRMNEAIAEVLGITVERYEEALDTARQRLADEGVELGGRGLMPGMFDGRRNGYGVGGNSLVGVAAERLGLTGEQLLDELESGKTISEVAQATGVELQTIVDAYLAPRIAALDSAVEQGRITREQADERIAHMEEEAREHLETTYPWQCDSSECAEQMEGGGFGLGGCMGDELQSSGRNETRAGRGSGMMGRGSR
jgi:hypothetical protein